MDKHILETPVAAVAIALYLCEVLKKLLWTIIDLVCIDETLWHSLWCSSSSQMEIRVLGEASE